MSEPMVTATVLERDVLACLLDGPAGAERLAQLVGVDLATTTHALEQLQLFGQIVPAPTGGRALTPAGLELALEHTFAR